mmetsp:Transcript_30090/g.101443  ORF Transcript_30090/g.101443 Transcript_30090/m.101443 type:complete len:217 (-) Transcript_30090:55-705(-)
MGLLHAYLATASVASGLVSSPLRQARAVSLRSAAEQEVVEVVLTEAQKLAKRSELEFRSTKYFFGRVDIYLGPEFKPLNEVFDPSFKDDSTSVSSVVVTAPFGMVIEESPTRRGRIEVLEVVDGSNAQKAGIQKGDILRGTTAMALNIQQASEEDFGFSIGVTEGKRQIAFLKVDNKKFDFVMAAIQSNALTNSGPGEATFCFERRIKAPEAAEAE